MLQNEFSFRNVSVNELFIELMSSITRFIFNFKCCQTRKMSSSHNDIFNGKLFENVNLLIYVGQRTVRLSSSANTIDIFETVFQKLFKKKTLLVGVTNFIRRYQK